MIVHVDPDPDGGFTAWIKDTLGCVGWGADEPLALSDLSAALRAVRRAEASAEFDRCARTEHGLRTGKRGRPDAYYAGVAAAYVKSCSEGRAPTARLAEQLGITQAAARSILTKARQRGLLTAPGRGAAGGELTPKALALTDNTDPEEHKP